MTINKIFLLAVFAVVFPLGAQEPFTIRANVNLVELRAKVFDSKGRSVSGLGKEAFQLFVDNAQQPISVFQREDAPVTVGIIIDNSASMAPKREDVITAAMAFAGASNSNDEMFVVHFNSRTRFGLPPGTLFTGRTRELETAVSAFDLGGTTAFYDALLVAQERLRSAAYPRRILVTITDGGDNSSRATLVKALDNLREAGTVVYSIGLFDENDRDRNPEVLSMLARETGGEAFFPQRLNEISNICITIAEEIRKRYTVGFPGIEDGQYHRVRLAATDPRYGPLQVETRPGYIASAPTRGQ